MAQTATRSNTKPAPPARPAHSGEQSSPVASALQRVQEGYKGVDMPLGGYAAIMGAYGLVVGGLLWAASRKKDRPLAESVNVGDVVLLGVATHKVSRLITKDWVTSPLRAPFTEYKKTSSAGEVEEKGRGQGLQLAMGQLLT